MSRQQVLVVEDDPVVRADATLLLKEAGLEVVETDNADDALIYAMEQAQDLAAIFVDVQLPGDTDGFDLAETVARHWPHIVLLVTSGRERPAGALPGNVRFLPKPWRPLDVLTAMQNAAAPPLRAIPPESGASS